MDVQMLFPHLCLSHHCLIIHFQENSDHFHSWTSLYPCPSPELSRDSTSRAGIIWHTITQVHKWTCLLHYTENSKEDSDLVCFAHHCIPWTFEFLSFPGILLLSVGRMCRLQPMLSDKPTCRKAWPFTNGQRLTTRIQRPVGGLVKVIRTININCLNWVKESFPFGN